jgi:hypothetical protein
MCRLNDILCPNQISSAHIVFFNGGTLREMIGAPALTVPKPRVVDHKRNSVHVLTSR